MTELTIDRFTSTVQLTDDGDDPGLRMDRLADRVAGSRLDSVAANTVLLPGDWCVRRVTVPLVLDFDRPAVALEEQWAQAVIDAIGAAIDHPSAEVVHYRRRVDALRDLLLSTARCSTERQWAWRQVGLLVAADASPATDPQTTVRGALRRFPRDALYALLSAIRDAGLVAVHRLLGAEGWEEAATLVCAVNGWSTPSPLRSVAAPVPSGRAAVRPTDIARPSSDDPREPSAPAPAAASASAMSLAETVVARSTLCATLRGAPIRPHAHTIWNWAILAAAESDPSILTRPNSAEVLDAIAALIIEQFAAHTPTTGLHGAVSPPATARNEASRTTPPDTLGGAEHVDIPKPAGIETDWAGMLFLLNTAADADIPDAILNDDVLAGRPLIQILSAVATHIAPAANDDPAVLSFSGQLAGPGRFTALTDHEAERVAAHAQRWITTTLARIDEPDTDHDDLLARIVARHGVIQAEPGWIEVHLDLADVDVDVRIAGLDVDPDWVPWLGAVVRFCYV
jgi:hypothetical protein